MGGAGRVPEDTDSAGEAGAATAVAELRGQSDPHPQAGEVTVSLSVAVRVC